MKITNITSYVTDALGHNIIFVKTETDEGLTGWARRIVSGPISALLPQLTILKTGSLTKTLGISRACGLRCTKGCASLPVPSASPRLAV